MKHTELLDEKKNRAEVSSCRGAKERKFHPLYTEFSVPVPILLFEYEPSRGDMKLPQPTIQITLKAHFMSGAT